MNEIYVARFQKVSRCSDFNWDFFMRLLLHSKLKLPTLRLFHLKEFYNLPAD